MRSRPVGWPRRMRLVRAATPTRRSGMARSLDGAVPPATNLAVSEPRPFSADFQRGLVRGAVASEMTAPGRLDEQPPSHDALAGFPFPDVVASPLNEIGASGVDVQLLIVVLVPVTGCMAQL